MTDQGGQPFGELPRTGATRTSFFLLILLLLILPSTPFADNIQVQKRGGRVAETQDNADNIELYDATRDALRLTSETKKLLVESANTVASDGSEKGRLDPRDDRMNNGSIEGRLGARLVSRSKRVGGDHILPSSCPFPPSCSARREATGPVIDAFRYPCKCDDQCHRYGDCCHDVARTKSSSYSSPKSCLPLHPPSPFTSRRAVYMVAQCPPETSDALSAMCAKKSQYTYLMDIPVVSATTDIVYTNIFCAKCHRDTLIEQFTFNVVCSEGHVSSANDLVSMIYLPGTLSWTTREADSLADQRYGRSSGVNDSGRQNETSCLLILDYGESTGRSCEINLVEECSEDWSLDETRKNCSSYNYYVSYEGKQYKNWDCAICNGVSKDKILCLSKFHPVQRTVPPPPPSLTDLFVVDGDCEEDHVWDILHHRCERVSCAYLFSLQDGECVRNNRTAGRDGNSYLNSSCYTTEYRRNYSVMFSNQSIYLNFTEQMYEVGEYEFVNHTWIRVCLPETMWTPAMNVISTVLICISLICMLLHILIFLALPRRRNIPSMNLFSMTCSLFLAELVFVSFFRLNGNYAGCVAIAVIMYYFLSASFLWMNVMSIDICRTFHSNRYKIKSKKIFIQYSLYAWSVPLVSTIIALLVDQLAEETFAITPQFGTHNCWFNNKWGLVVFFTFPSGLVVLLNMVLYSISVYDIYKQHMSGEFASSSVRRNGASGQSKWEKEREKFLKKAADASEGNPPKDKSSDESDSARYADRIKERIQRRIQANKKQRVRLVLYCKLALMMGLTWIFAFISLHTKSLVFEYLFIIFNGLQGTFIFIAFDCKQKQWEELKQRFGRGTPLQNGGTSSTNQTSMTTSSGGRYKYRWSSSRRQQDRSTWYSTNAEEKT